MCACVCVFVNVCLCICVCVCNVYVCVMYMYVPKIAGYGGEVAAPSAGHHDPESEGHH